VEPVDDPFGAVPFDAEKIKRHLAKQNSLKGGSKVDFLSGHTLDLCRPSNSGQLSFEALNDHELVEFVKPIIMPSYESNRMQLNDCKPSSSNSLRSQSKRNQDLIWF
jgi:hypothetical protein